MPLDALVLAAHATVLSALSGEADVVTGAVTGGQTLPCRLGTAPATWRELVHETAQVRALLVEHGDVAIDELRRQLGVAGPTFETVLARPAATARTDRARRRRSAGVCARATGSTCVIAPTPSTTTRRPGSPATT